MFCCFSDKIALATFEDAEQFVLPITKVKVVKVYDGDTVTVAFHLNRVLYKTQIRLSGIDAPEIKGKSETEKAKARLARDALSAKIFNQVVELKNTRNESKWGRLLAEIWFENKNISDWMIEEGHCVPYQGEKKTFDWGNTA